MSLSLSLSLWPCLFDTKAPPTNTVSGWLGG